MLSSPITVTNLGILEIVGFKVKSSGKKIMRRHLQSAKHSDMLEKSKRKEEIEFKEMTRNKKISLTLGRIVYKNLYHGAALAMLAKEGVDVGELK